MLETRTRHAGWLALCLASAIGCSAGSATQVVTGHVTARDAIAVRALDGTSVVTAAPVRSDRSFTLALPKGQRYRLEVLTAAGVKHVLAAGDKQLGSLTFEVCEASAPWDIGVLSPPGKADCPANDPKCDGGGGGGDPGCPPDDPKCDGGGGTDPNCPPGDPKCDGGGTDPNCPPGDPKCDGGGGGDPSCPPGDPKCDGGGDDPGCPAGDPKCDGGGGDPGCPADDPKCKPCDVSAGGDCVPPEPPVCDASKDPDACLDPCEKDPTICGCPDKDPKCWGTPDGPVCDATGACSAEDALTPEHPPIDFGCGKSP